MATPKVEDIAPFAFWGAIANASYALLHVFPDGNLPTRFTEALHNAHTSIARRIPADELSQMAPLSTATPLEILTFYGTPANRHRAEHLQRRMLRGALDKADTANLRAAPPLVV